MVFHNYILIVWYLIVGVLAYVHLRSLLMQQKVKITNHIINQHKYIDKLFMNEI